MYSVEKLTENIRRLTDSELQQLFQLLTDNAELLNKVMPEVPLIRHIIEDTGNTDNSLIRAYNNWKR